MIYDVGHRNPIPVPPPPEPDVELISSLGVPHRPIAGIPDLMHHKYAVRDGTSIWTGSTNWTDDSWSRQENVIVTVESPKLATAFTANFDELWSEAVVEQSGFVDPNPVRVGDIRVRAWFTPGFGEALSRRIAKRIRRAKRRVRICSPVLTVAPVLSALCERVANGLDIAGCLDRPQIEGVIYQWEEDGNAAWKLPLLKEALTAPFSAKPSTPWGAGSVHDFMHAKLTVVDDVVFTGSFNLSRSGERNAENVLEIEDATLAERLAAYVDEVRARLPPLHTSRIDQVASAIRSAISAIAPRKRSASVIAAPTRIRFASCVRRSVSGRGSSAVRNRQARRSTHIPINR